MVAVKTFCYWPKSDLILSFSPIPVHYTCPKSTYVFSSSILLKYYTIRSILHFSHLIENNQNAICDRNSITKATFGSRFIYCAKCSCYDTVPGSISYYCHTNQIYKSVDLKTKMD